MKHILMLSVVLGSVMTAGAASAATIVTETRLEHTPVPGPVVIDFRQFDENHDGRLSRREVGENLFYTFDRDGNQLIDNIEFNRPMVLSFAPMTQKTIQFVDYDGDGKTDNSFVTQQSFLQKTGLSRFDKTGNGISAADFIEKPIKMVDRDLSGQIDIREWKEAYNAIGRPLPMNDTFRYND